MQLNTEKIKGFIVEPNQEEFLRPLLLFRGGTTPGRAKSVYNFLRGAMDAELPTMTEIARLSAGEHDAAHFCGLHAKYGIQRIGLRGFFARLLQSPSVLNATPGMRDYIHWVAENSRAVIYPLDPISETSFWSKRDWRRVKPPRKPRKEREVLTEYYPFISRPTSDHELLLAVDSLVPKSLLSDTRADVCQDMIVAILSGEVSLENMRDAVPKYIKQFFKQSPSKYGHLSLDAPLVYGESKTLGETIAAEFH